jgi:Nif-specific regulatory protein
MRLGGTTPVIADVRIVCATNANLEEAIREKRFREDLYYRINVLEIVLPPLRERREDVPAIADAVALRLGDDAALRLPLSRAASRALSDAEWPGNIRQLENVVARGWATALSERAQAIEPRHLFGDKLPPTSSPTPSAELGSFQEATRLFQGKLVADTLTAAGWNVSEAARRLDLSRSHLNELIRAFALSRKKP